MYSHDSEAVAGKTFSYLGIFIWSLAAVFFLYEFFLRTLLSSMVSEVLTSLSINIEQLSFIDVAYCIAYGVMQIPVGILVDRYGVRRLLILATLLCAFGVFLFGFAQGFYLAFFSRLCMGLGSSFAFVCLLVLTLNYLPKKLHGTFFGFSQLLGAIGPMLAGAPIMLILQGMHDNWRLVLLMVGVFGLILAFLVYIFARESLIRTPLKVNLQPQVNFIDNIICVLKNRQVWWIVLYSSCIYASLALLGTLWGTQYLETHNIKAVHAAFITSILWVGLAVGSLCLGVLVDILQRKKLLLIFCAILGVVVTALIIYVPSNNLFLFSVLFFCLGVASAGQSVGFIAITGHVHANMRGTALGLNNAGISFVIALVVPLVGLLIQHVTHFKPNMHGLLLQQTSFKLGLTIMPILYILSFLIVFFGIKE